MKRIRPQDDYRDDAGYPSVEGLNRRSFFRRAFGAATATAGALTAGEATARGRAKAAKPEKVTLYLPGWVPIPGTGWRAQKVDLWTRDKMLARFLRKPAERAGIAKEVGKPVGKAKGDVLSDGRKLYQLERKIAQAVAKRYRQRTKRRVPAPDAMLYLTQRRRYIRTGGVIVRPRRPIRLPRRTP